LVPARLASESVAGGEQRFCKAKVEGSNPPTGSDFPALIYKYVLSLTPNGIELDIISL